MATYEFTMEIEGGTRPALVAEALFIVYGREGGKCLRGGSSDCGRSTPIGRAMAVGALACDAFGGLSAFPP